MSTVKEGDTIKIHYVGRLKNGDVFDSSENKPPLEFIVGSGELIQGLEQGVIGMRTGETKTISIPPELGYGPRIEDRIFEMDKSKMPGNFIIEPNMQLQMYRADGMPVMVTVTAVTDKTLTIDANHPLAGKTLIFDTTLVEIA